MIVSYPVSHGKSTTLRQSPNVHASIHAWLVAHKNRSYILPDRRTMDDTKAQWHPAFCAAMELGFKDNRDILEFIREQNVSQKPLSLDECGNACK